MRACRRAVDVHLNDGLAHARSEEAHLGLSTRNTRAVSAHAARAGNESFRASGSAATS